MICGSAKKFLALRLTKLLRTEITGNTVYFILQIYLVFLSKHIFGLLTLFLNL